LLLLPPPPAAHWPLLLPPLAVAGRQWGIALAIIRGGPPLAVAVRQRGIALAIGRGGRSSLLLSLRLTWSTARRRQQWSNFNMVDKCQQM
jgi:hypothetical protein